MLAGHGFGKTKTIFDVAGERFTILLDANEVKWNADVREMISSVNNIVSDFYSVNLFQNLFLTFQKETYDSKSQRDMEDLCAFEVRLTVAARLAVLQLLLALDIVKSPKDWLNLQLNGLASSYSFLYVCFFLKPVDNICSKSANTSESSILRIYLYLPTSYVKLSKAKRRSD